MIHLYIFVFFFFKQKTAYEIGLGIPAEPLFRSISCLIWLDLPPSPTKSSNLSETAEVPACNVPSRRSEERRVGKECRSRWPQHHQKRKARLLRLWSPTSTRYLASASICRYHGSV